MDTMKPDPKKQPQPPIAEGEERVEALFFFADVALPLDGVTGTCRKLHANESRTITKMKDGRWRIVETYRDKNRKTVVLRVPAGAAIDLPLL